MKKKYEKKYDMYMHICIYDDIYHMHIHVYMYMYIHIIYTYMHMVNIEIYIIYII